MSEVTFTITVTNNGLSNATNVVINDTLPDGLKWISGDLYKVIPLIKSNESYSFIVKASTTRLGEFVNSVSVYCFENSTVLEDSAVVNVYKTDIKINKTANVTSVLVNDLVNFTIDIRNHGEAPATNVKIFDDLNEAFEFVNAGGNYTRNGQSIVWNVGLQSEETYSTWIVVRVISNGTFENVASTNCSEEPTLEEDSATVEATIDARLNVVKVAQEDIVYYDETARFVITITNTGDLVITGLFVDEVIPEGLVYNNFIGTNWTKDGTKFYYNAPLDVGESIDLIIVVNTTKSGNFTNAIIVGSDNTDNQTAEDSIVVLTPSLNVREISNNPNVIAGQPVSFTVVVNNDGDCALGNVYVTNILPEGLIYTGFDGKNWNKVGDRFVYNGILNPGESIEYTLYFNTTRSGYFVPQVIAGSNLTSNTTSKAYSNNTTQVVSPSITVTKKANKNTVNVGELVIFTITVKNTGDCSVSDIFVIDELPEGLEFISFDGSEWTKEGNVYRYSGILAPGESISLKIVCNATKVTNITNVVIAGSNMTGNVSDSADVVILNNTNPTPEPEVHKKTTNESVDPKTTESPLDSKATGNPIIMLLLAILAIIPLKRRKQ